jgi:hypothetical protein
LVDVVVVVVVVAETMPWMVVPPARKVAPLLVLASRLMLLEPARVGTVADVPGAVDVIIVITDPPSTPLTSTRALGVVFAVCASTDFFEDGVLYELGGDARGTKPAENIGGRNARSASEKSGACAAFPLIVMP